MTVSIQIDKLKSIMAAIHKLANQDVLVGIPASETTRKDDTESNAVIGYKMEYGSPQEHIPARPSLIPGVTEVQGLVADCLTAAALAALNGDPAAVTRQMNKAGIIASTSVKKKINSNIQPALSQRTIAERIARGVTRTNTLVDTGQFRNSITYVIRKN